MKNLNSWSIWTCVLMQQILGYTWYSEVGFKNAWVTATGKPPEHLFLSVSIMMVSIASSLLMTRMMAWLFIKLEIREVWRGGLMGALLWTGFMGPLLALHDLGLGLQNSAIMMEAGKYFVAFVLTGLILALWKKKEVQ